MPLSRYPLDGTPATEKTSKAHKRQVSSGGKLNSQTGGCGDRPAAGTGTDAAIFTVGYYVSFAPFQPQLCATWGLPIAFFLYSRDKLYPKNCFIQLIEKVFFFLFFFLICLVFFFFYREIKKISTYVKELRKVDRNCSSFLRPTYWVSMKINQVISQIYCQSPITRDIYH